MSTFCRRHSGSLQSLYLDYSIADAGATNWETETLVLPNLQEVKLKAPVNLFPLLNLDVVALKRLEFFINHDIWPHLPSLLDLPPDFFALESYRISGHSYQVFICVNPLLDNPGIVAQLAAPRDRRIGVEVHWSECADLACQGQGECFSPFGSF